MTERGFVLDHERIVVSTMIDVVNNTGKIQRNFLEQEKYTGLNKLSYYLPLFFFLTQVPIVVPYLFD